MKNKTRAAVYDEELQLEACRFRGVAQPFPNHFHEHYVLGLVEEGRRTLHCKNREYTIGQGSILLFNPGDTHACVQSDGGVLDYRSLNLPQETMLAVAADVTGRRELPGFSQNVVQDEELACWLRTLHEQVMRQDTGFGKEENLLLLVSALMQRYGQPFAACVPECPQEITRACAYMQAHYREKLSLDAISRCAGLSKSTLLRVFTKAKGITPYRYLETLRINAAKDLLAGGAQPLDAAMQTGFADQSHFTNYFSSYIGLAPGAYREIFGGGKEDGVSE